MDAALDADDLRLLLEIGYVAAGNGYFQEAEAIFRGVAAKRPESTAPSIGRAIAALNRGSAAEAAAILETERTRCPQDDLLRAFLGLALKSAGRTAESVALLNAVLDSADPTAANLARALLSSNSGA
jgi:tetratricopeptide (TPR) repeat protein